MIRCFRPATLLVAVALGPQFGHSAAPSQIVFQRSLSIDRSANVFTSDKFDVKFLLGDSFFTPTNPVALFDGVSITPADVGKVLTSSPATDPRFAPVVERITDSHNQFIQFLMTEHASGRTEKRGWNERGFFTGVATSTAPDLAGATITSLALAIDGFTLLPPTSAASTSAVGGGPPVALQMTFTVYGVPEPGAVLLAACGLPLVRRVRYTARVRACSR